MKRFHTNGIPVLSLLLLLLVGVAVFRILPRPAIQLRPVETSWVRVTEQMGIQNMVTAVYLGPRMMDTLIEVMVVVLTVYGMKHLRGRV